MSVIRAKMISDNNKFRAIRLRIKEVKNFGIYIKLISIISIVAMHVSPAPALLNYDVQVQTVGTSNLLPNQEVVTPGPSILTVGPLGDTDPEGDDVCATPLVNGFCTGAILAGSNGIAETHANNRNTNLSLTGPELSSAYRNPRRNRDVGSTIVNSPHTRGRALDFSPRHLSVPGKATQQLMCIIEHAGDNVVGTGNSFTENGPSLVVNCDATATHVHIQN